MKMESALAFPLLDEIEAAGMLNIFEHLVRDAAAFTPRRLD
jgi:hypothetical protein